MNEADYSIGQLVADLERVRSQFKDEREIVAAVRPLALRAARSTASWLEGGLYRADPVQGFGVHVLHEKADHSLAVLAVCWLPHRGAPPHDHGTWAVVAAVDGPERNEFFERADDRSRPGYAELRKVGEKVFQAGEVVGMPAGVIHSIWNDTEATTLSLHIYGMHPNFTERSQFDVENKTEMPFKVAVVQREEACS